MKTSILHSNDASVGKIGARTLYHLSLDDTVAGFCRDEGKRRYFLRMLSNPLQSASDIARRQEVIRDFLQCEGLYAELSSLLTRFGALRGQYEAHHRETAKTLSDPTLLQTDFLRNLVQASALTFKRCLLFLRAIADVLEKYPISAACLRELLEDIGQYTRSSGYEGLLPILQWFSVMGVRYVLVSHLLELEPRLLDENVTVLRTQEGFRIGQSRNYR